ncbi:MAG: class I SAM-dependent methyltransferase [Chloroflexota bacterium]
MGGADSSPFDSFADAYDDWFRSGEGRSIFITEVLAFRKVLDLLPQPWIEVGVGSGRFAQALGIGLGLDPSVALLHKADRRRVEVVRGRGEQIPFRSHSFGTAFLIVTLCFVKRPLDVLRDTHRVLVANGALVLGLVLSQSAWGQFYGRQKEQGHRFYRRATFYSYQDVLMLLGRTGFEVQRVISTLFQRPGQVRSVEQAQVGYQSDAGFTVLVATKR